MKLRLYNTLTLKKETFEPIDKNLVGLYTCGPTVYNYAHIGNFRTYLFEDILKRVLFYNGYEVKHVMNITDVGHLTGDGDMGEDKLEKSARDSGKTAWDVAEFYTRAFQEDMEKLNILPPDIWDKATDTISEQVELVRALEDKGYTYITSDGVYFDTSKLSRYNKLSHQPLENLNEGARVERNEEKRNPTDFALWKFSPKNEKRQMEWDSPWGVGFPGWHIECSAIAMKNLPNNQDIHCGGVDHINVHHTNEIAQSETVTGKNFFHWWMHGEFLNISGGKKMAKSGNNFLTLENALIKKGIDPIVYRYAVLGVHYRKPMEYSEIILHQAENALANIKSALDCFDGGDLEKAKKEKPNKDAKKKFLEAVNDDLNMPEALAVFYDVLKSDLKGVEKVATLLDFDKVLGLGFDKMISDRREVPEEIHRLADERQEAREKKNWAKADELRGKIEEMGYMIIDEGEGYSLSESK